jgi:DNA-binding response OmpR family regulator
MRDELDEAELKAELWVSHLVCKPFSPRELLKTVQETLAAIEAVSTEHSA